MKIMQSDYLEKINKYETEREKGLFEFSEKQSKGNKLLEVNTKENRYNVTPIQQMDKYQK